MITYHVSQVVQIVRFLLPQSAHTDSIAVTSLRFLEPFLTVEQYAQIIPSGREFWSEKRFLQGV